MDVVDVLGWVCLLVALCLFSSGIPPCIQMYQNQSTKNVPFTLFLLNIISCSGMMHYGMMIGNSTLIILNAAGFVLQTCYVLTYFNVTRYKAEAFFKIMAALCYELLLYFYLYVVMTNKDDIPQTLGYCSSLVVALIMALPAFDLYENIKSKHADGVPAIIVICTLMSCICWLAYGMLLKDPNIYRPNFIGIAVALAKLVVIGLYG